MRLRIDLRELNKIPADLERLGNRIGAEVNYAMSESARAIHADILERYYLERIGARSRPAMYSGRWASGLKILTRGTGTSLGRSFVIIQQTVPYAEELERGAPVNRSDMPELIDWASKKFGKSPKDARKMAGNIVRRGKTMPQPILEGYNLAQVSSLIDGFFEQAINRAVGGAERGR